ncbi:MAG: alpha/beta fold hydrolase [Deltaproteobacteria bacterium]|nr:alpha/beta fold hydrolase [Deltaproteobacteria bacterium]
MCAQPDSFRVLYPFESHFLDLGGIRYHYLDEGHGEPIVMLHGNPTWSFYYRHLITALRGRYHVIAPDHVGCGFSDKPQKYEYTLERHIANLEALMEHLALKRITLVMHDWGGPIGMGYAMRHPEQVRRFVIFNTAAFWSPHIPLSLRLCRTPFFGAIAIRGLNLFAGLAAIIACRHRERMTKEVRAGYLAPYNSYANRIAISRFVQDLPVDSQHPSYDLLQSIEKGLVQFKHHPMIIIWGGRDPVFTDLFLKSWQGRFPDASVKRIDDAGHYVVEDAYERIIPWINEFLENSPI